MTYLIDCMISPTNDIVANHNPIVAELKYSDYTLFLKLSNLSDDSVYLYTDVSNRIDVTYNGKRVDAEFLYNFNDLTIPDPPKFDSLDQTNHRIAAILNYPRPEKVDSTLLDFLISEYLRLNKRDNISPIEYPILLSKLEVAMFSTGGLIFLRPNESYTFKYEYTCFKKYHGKYKVECHGSKINKNEYYETEGFTKNTIIKLPFKPPLKFMGFTRYNELIHCKTINFTSK